MGALPVVVHGPVLQLFPCVCKAERPASVKAFCPEASADLIDNICIGGFPRAAEVECDAVGVSPDAKVSGDELRSLIDVDGGVTGLDTDPFERLHYILAAWTFCCAIAGLTRNRYVGFSSD
jgi:hypothetical protein